ncbi:MAG: hypothetical protein CFH10_01904 [Alphaproteobacteria bacterium MarineAlpha4_Bin2]|nr:MAG: hypothetical protein CFH10_01904 [Alphaproteobacteria bacterium MarineAlpha4_Bin2]
MSELKSEFLFTIRVTVDHLHDVGETPFGTRHIDILGKGIFEGPKLKGTVLGGMDQKIFRSDGAMNPNVRLILQTDDDALIYMSYTGLRHGSAEVMQRLSDGYVVDPSEYYLRNTPYFETSASQYDWLNRIVSVGVGRRMPDHALYDIFEIL